MNRLIILLAAALCACAATPQTVKEYIYVKDRIPSELLVEPKPVPDIDLSAATQAEVSDWIVLSEQYAVDLLSKLRGVKAWDAK